MNVFPTSPMESKGKVSSIHDGLTLRDYFASQVLLGLMSRSYLDETNNIAAYCYKLSDAMIRAREGR